MIRALLLIALLGCMVGCASQPEEETYTPPRLMIAQNGDGDVTLQWESEPGFVYTIFYQTSANSDWQGLNKAFRVPGNGETITVYDHVNPNRPRKYRILQEKLQ